MTQKRQSLWTLEKLFNMGFRDDLYIDGDGNGSVMSWIPPFRACRALNTVAAPATPSGTVGDWFHPEDIQTGWALGTDYEIVEMGGFWIDKYLCSSPDATATSAGTTANGSTVKAYVSQPGVVPRVNQTIAHFKTYLAARFSSGGFSGTSAAGGSGGLCPDAYWFELWILTRINRWLLRGNTNGYNSTEDPKVPHWHADPNGSIGMLDPTQAQYGASLTGGGPKEWDVPISDFCGNRWEFTDGLRLYNGTIFTAGKTIDPPGDYADAAYTDTGIQITGVSSGGSISAYRTEDAIKHIGIPLTTTSAGGGRFDGQGFFFSSDGERVAGRGGACPNGALCPGSLYLFDPSYANWYIGARAVLVP